MSENNNIPDYVTFGKTFEKYKWYKPILVFIIGLIIYTLLQFVVIIFIGAIYGTNTLNMVLSGGYDTIDASDAGFYISYLSIILFAPAIYISSRIVKDRPFSSYSSSRGGWDWKLYFKCLIIPFIIYLIFTIVENIIFGGKSGHSNVTLTVLILALIFIPLQCIAEEHFFRGLVMQTLGSWFNIPILAVIIQSIIFAMTHPYNILGVIGILISGLAFGFLAWKTNGLESASALHTINNLMSFYLAALGFDVLQSNITTKDFISSIIVTLVSAAIIYYIGTKYEWFNKKTSENKALS
ncbi:lysostaphin resistance A-like protein [Methanobrevibacter sp.]